MSRLSLIAFATVAWLGGAGSAQPQEIRFKEQTVPFVLENDESAERYAPETMPGGVAAFDYDGDGDLDLFFTNGADLPQGRKTGEEHWNRLFRNDGQGQFRDVTVSAGVRGSNYDFGAAVADYDNDGDSDLFVAGLHANRLYRNDGGRFLDVSLPAGLGARAEKTAQLWSVAAAWLDFDRDGWLDLFVVNYLRWHPGIDPVCDDRGKRDYCHPKYYRGSPNQLFRNQGDGTFEDVSRRVGLAKYVGKGMSAGIADFDGDGWPDIFVTNDKLPNYLFRNDRGENLIDAAFDSTAALPEHGRDVSGMGLDVADMDNDGLPDIVYTALPGETFPLLQNSADGFFDDITRRSGLAARVNRLAGYSALFADFDNDGHKDIFFSCGDVQAQPISPDLPVEQHNLVLRNTRDGKFSNVESSGFEQGAPRRHRGAAVGDFDGDGDLDLAVTALGHETELWWNDSPAGHNWIQVRLRGTTSNRDGIGAVIHIQTSAGTQSWHVSTSRGYASSSAGPAHFGLGTAKAVDVLEVYWPTGKSQRFEAIDSNQVIEIDETSGLLNE